MLSHSTTLARFQTAYVQAAGFYPSAGIGVPNTRCHWYCSPVFAHQWPGTSVYVQDFSGGYPSFNNIIVDGVGGASAGVLFAVIWARFITENGPVNFGRVRSNMGGGYSEHDWCGTRTADFEGVGSKAPAALVTESAGTARWLWAGPFAKYAAVAGGGPCVYGPPVTEMLGSGSTLHFLTKKNNQCYKVTATTITAVSGPC